MKRTARTVNVTKMTMEMATATYQKKPPLTAGCKRSIVMVIHPIRNAISPT